MQLNVSEAERTLLLSILQREAQDLRSENYHAESHAAKEIIKARAAEIAALIDKFKTG